MGTGGTQRQISKNVDLGGSMTGVNIWFIIIFYLIDIICFIFYSNRIENGKARELPQFLWSGCYLAISVWEQHNWGCFWFGACLFTIFAVVNVWFYDNKRQRRLRFSLFYVASYIMIKAVVYACMRMFLPIVPASATFCVIGRAVVLRLLMLAFLHIVVFRKKWNTDELPRKIFIGVIVTIFGSALFTVSITQSFQSPYFEEVEYGMQLEIVGMLFLMVVTYWLFGRLCIAYQELLEQQQLQADYEKREAHYKEIARSQAEIRKLRHDMKNQLLELDLHIQENLKGERQKEALVMVEDLRGKLDAASPKVYSDCFAINGILRVKFDEARECGIRVEHEIKLGGDLHMERGDMGVILGNLLDNAIEASQNEKSPVIRVKILQKKEQLLLEICNTYTGYVRWQTTKKDCKKHGIGLRSVEQVVKKYNGRLDLHQEKEQVVARVLLMGVVSYCPRS